MFSPRKFALVVSWELRRSYHSYLFEIIGGVLVYGFVVSGSVSEVAGCCAGMSPSFLYSQLASMTFLRVYASLSYSFFFVGVLAAIIASLTFSSEVESGLARTYLSLPLGKGTFFLGKVLSVLALLFVSILIASVYQLVIYDTQGAANTVLYADWGSLILYACVTAVIGSFLVLPIAVAVRNAWVSSVASIALIYGLQAAGQQVFSSFLPPVYLESVVGGGLKSVVGDPASPFMAILYAGLFAFSYLYFKRKVEIR
jgi:ABC-type transport system involved in multi-copper enzyme maturation permease subunit